MEFEYFVLLSVDSLQHINCFAIIMVGGKRCLGLGQMMLQLCPLYMVSKTPY